MKAIWIRGVLAALVLYGLGVVSGAASARARTAAMVADMLAANPVAARQGIVRWGLRTRLSLDDAQEQRLSEILSAQAPRYRALIESIEPGLGALRNELVDGLSPSLRPDQARQLKTGLQAMERSRRE